MEREHAVSMSVTNGTECICNPEILLGTNYGLWNFQKEVAPRGTLLDLNAAWELFLSREKLINDVHFDEEYHHQHEVIDGVVYEDGDTTYTLVDDKGNKTNATFTIKGNKGPVEHIEWQDGNLILYYTKTRPQTVEDRQSGIPIHYVYDSNGGLIVDQTTGEPLIYDYVKIPIIEIFDNDETHKLFPWFADNQHTVRLRQNLDETNEHLGDVAITTDSEVFIAKERFSENSGNTLVSVQSAYEQLKQDLGIEPTFSTVENLIDSEGASIHQRVNGSNLQNVLNTKNKDSIVSAINESVQENFDVIKLISGETINEPIQNIPTFLQFNEYLLNHNYPFKEGDNVRNLLWALNNLQHYDLGDFQDSINQNIKNIDGAKVSNITEALNAIFKEAEENRNRIGWDGTKWIELTTKNKENLTSAINEVDEHTDELAKIVNVRERWDTINKKTYYDNPNLNSITKNRLRVLSVDKDNTTIIEDINELQAQIGNLDSTKSGITNQKDLSTDNKNNIVEAINEVDLHSDNNNSAIGAQYNVDANGKKQGEILNLTTDNKNTLVDAINELDSRVGELSDLNTDSKTNIVSSINEVIKESPFIYQNTEDPNSGVILKNNNNQSGNKSLVVGENNASSEYSLISGKNNNSTGNYTQISGSGNSSRKDYNNISGSNNNNDGQYNTINGNQNSIKGDFNLVHGSNNTLNDSTKTLVVGEDNEVNCENILVVGSENFVKANSKNSVALGQNNKINGSNSLSFGKDNILQDNSIILGNSNESSDSNNISIGDNNTITNKDNLVLGSAHTIEGKENTILGNNLEVEGNSNIIISNEQQRINNSNSIVIGKLETIHNNATHIGRDIYIQTHDTESKLQSLIFVDLNDWCKKNNASSLNGEKFLDSAHLVQALKVYLASEYSDNALIRFKMLDDNENGFIIIQGKSKRIYVNGTWYFSDNIENGWSRHDGTYLKVIKKKTVNNVGNTVIKHYLAFMDQLSTEAVVDTVGAQRSNTEDYRSIDLTHAYGAVDFDDINEALDLDNRFKQKVDKYAQIITNYYDSNGVVTPKVQNFVDPDNSNNSGNIILDLKESFGLDVDTFQIRSERGEPNGYVPLNAGGLIDQKYLPSYIDDVVDVWAEYQVDSRSGAVIDIHLYELDTQIVPTTGQEIVSRGKEILQGETGKIYVEANPNPHRRFSTQFRWTGNQYVAIGFSNITIGEAEGTAFDGQRGKIVEDTLQDHLNSGTTLTQKLDPNTGEPVLDENGNVEWVTYKPNPHHVTAKQLDIVINDPNDPDNVNLEERFIKDCTVFSALQNLFDRINLIEDTTDTVSTITATPEQLQTLDNLDDIVGNKTPTILGLALSNKERLDAFVDIPDATIIDNVTNYFKFYGEA